MERARNIAEQRYAVKALIPMDAPFDGPVCLAPERAVIQPAGDPVDAKRNSENHKGRCHRVNFKEARSLCHSRNLASARLPTRCKAVPMAKQATIATDIGNSDDSNRERP